MTLENVLLVSALTFAIGLYGVLTRRNTISVLMAVELMFNAAVIAAVAFSRFTPPSSVLGAGSITTGELRLALAGQAFALFIIAVAAAEVALGLALVLALYRYRQSVEITDAASMKN